jgi:hypothetical protein
MIIKYFINVKNLIQVQFRCKNINILINYFFGRCMFAALYIVASFSMNIRTLDDVHWPIDYTLSRPMCCLPWLRKLALANV